MAHIGRLAVSGKTHEVLTLFDPLSPEEVDRCHPSTAPWRVFEPRLSMVNGSWAAEFVEIQRQLERPNPADTAYEAWSCGNPSVNLRSALKNVATAVLDAHWHERLTDDVLREVLMDAHGQARSTNPGNWDFGRLRRVAAAASKGAGGPG